MRSLTSYLFMIFMGMFWVFRMIVAFTSTLGIDIGFAPLNINMEIILLFVTFVCIILVGKAKLLGGIIYLVSYGMYFGVDLYNSVMTIINGGALSLTQASNVMVSFVGIVIPVVVFFTLLVDKNKEAHPIDKKTDWFYKNKEFDRKMDERADQNQYRNY